MMHFDLHLSHLSFIYMQINKCFPEILNCMAILNAPAFFSFSWRIIKRIIDPRTGKFVQGSLFLRISSDFILPFCSSDERSFLLPSPSYSC